MRVEKIPVFCVIQCLLGIVLTFTTVTALAESIHYSDSWADQGITVTRESSTGLELSFSLEQWNLGQLEIGGQSLRTVRIPGSFLPNDAGAPNLPGRGWFIAVPRGATAEVRVLDFRIESLTDFELAPAPRLPLETEDGPPDYSRNEILYTTDAMYPAEPVRLSTATQIRGIDVVHLGITPFQYNPVTRELIVYRDLEIEITFTGGDSHFGEDRLRSPWFDPILQASLLNADSLDEVVYHRHAGSRTPDFEYLIICPNISIFTDWADTLRTYRNEQGIRTGIVTTDDIGGNTPMAIESFIDDAYASWDIPPVAVLLLGDYETGSGGVIAPIYDDYCPSDNIYADVNGNHLPDIILARMTAQSEAHLATLVGKVIDYENQPPLNPAFYANPVIAGGWQTERWFILCDEVVHGFLTNELGKTPVREYAVYSGTPGSIWSSDDNTGMIVDYFGPMGLGYIPATPEHLTDWGSNATRINNGINSGAFFIQHRDHGSVNGWGVPDYKITDLAGLENSNLTFVLSVNCLTGSYNIPGECFAEVFHRHSAGALGIIAASETSYSFVNDAYTWGMFDFMWPNFDPGHGPNDSPGWGDPTAHRMLPAFASVSGKYYLHASNWPSNPQEKETTYHLFHHHGDAFTVVYSEVPQQLDISHEDVVFSGVEHFTISANEGALIGLAVDGEFLGSAMATGLPQSIPIPPQFADETVTVTVTKQNFFRYRADLPVVPPDGPFVIYNAHAINDEDGNNNGFLDFTEAGLLSLTLHNVGLEMSLDAVATITTEDSYLTIVDAVEEYGNIRVDGLAVVNDGFKVALDAGAPDEHSIPVTVSVTDTDSTYTSTFIIRAHAPNLLVPGSLIIDGENSILDPGETADLYVSLHNAGHSDVHQLMVVLGSPNPGVTINAPSYRIPVIQAAETEIAIFTLTADHSLQIGEVVELNLDVAARDYSYNTDLRLAIGLTIESFESGHFVTFPWDMAGDADWTVDSATPYEGVFCARSGTVNNYQSSEMMIDVDVLASGMLSFYYRVSSESDSDFLRFFIDGAEIDSWSGNIGWSHGEYPIDTGVHTFRWAYIKDGAGTAGQDCGWLDYIRFPAIGEPPRPRLSVDPLSFEIELAQGSLRTEMLTLDNSGEGGLNYYIALALNGNRQTDIPCLTLEKGETDPRPGEQHDRNSGGPDSFGYTWIDSDEPGGPNYNWVEISSIGTALTPGDDVNHGPIDMGFEVPFYGVPYEQIHICSNGWASFTSTSTAFTNQGIPYDEEPNNLIAPLWDDLNPESGGTIYYYSDLANRRFIIEWSGVHHFFEGDPETFQILIHEDGHIVFQYQIVADDSGCTIGIENASGTVGLQMLFNTPYLHNEMALLFASEPLPEPWISIDPTAGVVPPGNSDPLSVVFNTIDCDVGDYSGSISVHSNDPESQIVDIPVLLQVREAETGVDRRLPTLYSLEKAFPNPFNPTTTIAFAIPHDGLVKVEIFDLAGRLVRTLLNDGLEAGYHSLTWNGRDDHDRYVASSTYYCRLAADGFSATRKVVLIK